ncbi:hypothetical protein ABT093_19610 [Kitasatospora sp. NPDC002551]|uniref:hypothetical protein n=1 Tax=Kitasatospora sp. NPDC002551 TaxID=3154539 RepID=UPI00331F25C7
MTGTQTPANLTGNYAPNAPGARTYRDTRPLTVDGKRVTVTVEGPAGRTAYLFIGGICGEPYELPADVTDVNLWAQQVIAEQAARPEAQAAAQPAPATAPAPLPVATVNVPGAFAEWLEGTNAMTGDDDHDPRSLALRLAVQGGRWVQRGRSRSLVVEGGKLTMSVLTEYADTFLDMFCVEDGSATRAEMAGAKKAQERALAARAALVAAERAEQRRRARQAKAMYEAVAGASIQDKAAVFYGFNPGVRGVNIPEFIAAQLDRANAALEGYEWEPVSPAEMDVLFDLADKASDYRAAGPQRGAQHS